MAKTNRFDNQIDSLAIGLSKVEGFQNFISTPAGYQMYLFMTIKSMELSAFKSLILDYYLPASERAVISTVAEYGRSKHKNLFKITNDELRENYNDTIRWAYVNIYHRLENYITGCIKHSKELIESIVEDGYSIDTKSAFKDFFAKGEKEIKMSETTRRLSWIANTIKHSEAIPTKPGDFIGFDQIKMGERLKLTRKQFIEEVDNLITFYPKIVELCLYMCIYGMTKQWSNPDSDIENPRMTETRERVSKIYSEMRNL